MSANGQPPPAGLESLGNSVLEHAGVPAYAPHRVGAGLSLPDAASIGLGVVLSLFPGIQHVAEHEAQAALDVIDGQIKIALEVGGVGGNLIAASLGRSREYLVAYLASKGITPKPAG